MTPSPFQRLRPGLILGIGMFLFATQAEAQVTVLLGGNASGNIATALNHLEIPYIDATGIMNPDPLSYELGAGDFIITSNDGGSGPFIDYTDFLNSGGHLIVVGGSSLDSYRAWASLYFNITDTGAGWHVDGDWYNLNADNGLGLNYAFENNSASFHMLAFDATPNTHFYGKNDEGQFVAALRTFNNNGSINYMALDVGNYGTANDIVNFVVPWLNTSFTPVAFIPEPSTYLLLASGLSALWVGRRRRRAASAAASRDARA